MLTKWGVSSIGVPFWGPHNKEYSIWGSIYTLNPKPLGSEYLGQLLSEAKRIGVSVFGSLGFQPLLKSFQVSKKKASANSTLNPEAYITPL